MSSLTQNATEQPSLVIVYFGGNDSLLPHPSGLGQHVPLQEYIQNMRKIAIHLQVNFHTRVALFLLLLLLYILHPSSISCALLAIWVFFTSNIYHWHECHWLPEPLKEDSHHISWCSTCQWGTNSWKQVLIAIELLFDYYNFTKRKGRYIHNSDNILIWRLWLHSDTYNLSYTAFDLLILAYDKFRG